MDCGDLFVALCRYQNQWDCEKQNKFFRFDRKACLFGKTVYFEVERGSQKGDKLRTKLEAYKKHYSETGEKFHVIFTVQDYRPNPLEDVVVTGKKKGQELLKLFEEFKLPGNYLVCYQQSLAADPLKAELVSRFNKHTLETLPD